MIDPCNCGCDANPTGSLSTVNRPGLPALDYRIGTHATFFNAMRLRLSAFHLTGLKTREASDPAVALLDAWATVADVLTFYQERIANEGYLRTAAERRSVLELAQLVGSSLRPGLSASVSVAYTLEQSSISTIPAGSRVQSVPVQDQLPQSFETADDLPARGAWNNLAPRLTEPQNVTVGAETIYVAGLTSDLKPGEPLLFVNDPDGEDPEGTTRKVRRITVIEPQAAADRTRMDIEHPEGVKTVAGQGVIAAHVAASAASEPRSRITSFIDLIGPLTRPAAEHPLSTRHLPRTLSQTFSPHSDAVPATVSMLNPEIRSQLYAAWRNAKVAPDPKGQVHAFRVKAAPFGHNAPLRPITNEKGVVVDTEEWLLGEPLSISIAIRARATAVRSAEEDDVSPALMRAAIREEQLSGEIEMSQGRDRGSASFTLGNEAGTTVNVGRWKVKHSFDRRNLTIKFVCEDAPRWAWTLHIEARAQQVTLTPEAGTPLVISPGQQAAATGPGYRLALSAVRDLTIKGEIAVVAPNVIELDTVYEQIARGSWVAIEFADGRTTFVSQAAKVEKVSIARYGIAGRVTRLTLKDNWLDDKADRMLSGIRSATVLAQSQRLDLAEQPITEDVAGDTIELGDLYGDIPTGRWLIVEGERADIRATGVRAAELVMLAAVEQLPPEKPGEGEEPIAGERKHSLLKLSNRLGYRYKRDSVTVYGNVALATHGEARTEVLGSGDGSQANQQFTLRQGPVTHLPAAVRGGVRSTLEVRVNDIAWTEVATLDNAGPYDRSYVTQIDDGNRTTIVFGDGIKGMRLPTGRENVTAKYRAGLGSAGNLPAGAISQLASRPFGVKEVFSPLPASGGVDRDDRDQGKMQVALAGVVDRLVSVQDCVDFARTFGGIGKAAALLSHAGRQRSIYLCIAGKTPKDDTAMLQLNVEQALRLTGDPHLPIKVTACDPILLVIAARVSVAAGHRWDDVEPRIRASLVETFGYARRNLGQSVALSEVTAAIQFVTGVAYVDMTALAAIGASDAAFDEKLRDKLAVISSEVSPPPFIEVRPIQIDQQTREPLPAQLLYLSADIPDTLILVEIPA